MSYLHLKVGDPVIIADNRGQRASHVTKVGRKWVYVAQWYFKKADDPRAPYHPNDPAFLRTTGVEKSGYGSPARIFTQETWEAHYRRLHALKTLRETAFEQWPTETLEAVVALLESST